VYILLIDNLLQLYGEDSSDYDSVADDLSLLHLNNAGGAANTNNNISQQQHYRQQHHYQDWLDKDIWSWY